MSTRISVQHLGSRETVRRLRGAGHSAHSLPVNDTYDWIVTSASLADALEADRQTWESHPEAVSAAEAALRYARRAREVAAEENANARGVPEA